MRYVVKWKTVKRKENTEAGRVRSWKALWSMLMVFIFRTPRSRWRTLSRAVTESEMPFRNIPLVYDEGDGLGGDKEKEKCDMSLAISQVAGAVLISYSHTKQEGTQRAKFQKHLRSTIHSLLVTEWMCRVREGRMHTNAHVSHLDNCTVDGRQLLALRPGTQEEEISARACVWWLWYD